MAKYAYCRVSTIAQSEDRQIVEMAKLEIPKEQVFVDKQSGKDFNREKYLVLVENLKAGDLLYVTSIDRLGRNYDEILNQWRMLTKERGVDIVVLDMPILDTRARHEGDLMGKVIADVVLQLLSFVAHKEYELIHQRQADGIRAARARGVKFGRPSKKPPENFGVLVKEWERGKLKLKDLLQEIQFTEATFYRRLREMRGKKK